jgi:integrase
VSLPKPRRNPASTDPETAWVVRYSAPAAPGARRRQPRVYGRTEKLCSEALIAALGQVQAGRHVDDRRTKFGDHLDRRLRWWESEADLKPSTLASYREAVELYLRPGLGHLRVMDLSEHHFRDLAAAMRLINRPESDADKSDQLRRLLAARATRDGKRISTRPLTEARIRRVLAVASSALSDLVPRVLPANPAGGKKAGKARKVRPLLWTPPRVERWQQTGEVPSRVMVWSRELCGAFLDSIEAERLYALFHLAAYYGPRRNELCILTWADTDLAARRVHIRGDVKSEDSDRILVIDQVTADVLKAWRKAQLAERMRWAGVWTDSGRVFTREDGTPLRPEWVSERFDTLSARAGLPPITLHGLRHGAATMALAAGVPIKAISEMLGHATSAFTADVYTEVAEELAEAAASAIAAFIPRRATNVPSGGINDR